jgi:hypothetical protein
MSDDPKSGEPATYTDEERFIVAQDAGKMLMEQLPKDDAVAFALVVAARTPDGKSRFDVVTNLPPRDAARLLTRAAFSLSKAGVEDVLSSPSHMIRRN